MFVIPCKYTHSSTGVIDLVKQIRQYHPSDKIVVVDSSSTENYFNEISQYNVIIEDVANKHYFIGAYWHAFKKYPNEDYYFFLHDSMYCKANVDYLKEKDLFVLATFNRAVAPSFTMWNERIKNETTIDHKYITKEGRGCYGAIFGCKQHVMKKLQDLGCDKFLPSTKGETGIMEGTWGLFLESLGYNLDQHCLLGDILELESPNGRSGVFPHNTSWEHPFEKYYNSLRDAIRNI